MSSAPSAVSGGSRNANQRLAVLVCAVVYYAIESVWFTVLGTPWLHALGKTLPEILAEMNGRPIWPLYVGAFICNFFVALVMAWVFARAGVRSAPGRNPVGGDFVVWFCGHRDDHKLFFRDPQHDPDRDRCRMPPGRNARHRRDSGRMAKENAFKRGRSDAGCVIIPLRYGLRER